MPDGCAAIALGANLSGPAGQPAQSLTSAIEHLVAAGLAPVAVSRFWHSPAVPSGSGPDFVNACALIRAVAGPADTLATLHQIEAGLGRERHHRWGPRAVDLDLLGQGHEILPDPTTHARWVNLPPCEQIRQTPDELILPHPRLWDRAFVLLPLCELVPDWTPAGRSFSVAQAVRRLPPADLNGLSPFRMR